MFNSIWKTNVEERRLKSVDLSISLYHQNWYWIFFSAKIQEIQLFIDHLVVYERENGLLKIVVYHLPPIGEPLRRLEGGHAVSFIDPVYSVESSESDFSSSILRFSYSSLKTPSSVYDYDMNTRTSVLKKIDAVSNMSNWTSKLHSWVSPCETR